MITDAAAPWKNSVRAMAVLRSSGRMTFWTRGCLTPRRVQSRKKAASNAAATMEPSEVARASKYHIAGRDRAIEICETAIRPYRGQRPSAQSATAPRGDPGSSVVFWVRLPSIFTTDRRVLAESRRHERAQLAEQDRLRLSDLLEVLEPLQAFPEGCYIRAGREGDVQRRRRDGAELVQVGEDR